MVGLEKDSHREMILDDGGLVGESSRLFAEDVDNIDVIRLTANRTVLPTLHRAFS